MRRRGFTLLEVLVALAVFGVAAVGLAAAYVNVLNAYEVVGRGNSRSEDIRFARAQLLAEPDRKKAEEGSDFEAAAGGRLTWRATIEPTSTANLFQVEFTCEVAAALTGGAKEQSVTERFLLLRPTWSEGIDTTKMREDARTRILELKNNKL